MNQTTGGTGLYNCDRSTPYVTQFKINGSTPLPWDFQAAAVYQNIPGPNYTASVTYSSAQIAPSLGRPLAGSTANVTIDVLRPWSMFLDKRINQVDARLSRIFTMGRWKVQANADVYNLLNASPVLYPNGTYGNYGTGTGWLRPNQILNPRIFKFSAQVDF